MLEYAKQIITEIKPVCFDCMEDVMDDGANLIISSLKGPLFSKKRNDTDTKLYGVTVNIQPTRLMNRKQWKLYSHDDQIKILTRVERRFRTDNPNVRLVELHFEICPKLLQIHYHALYEMHEETINAMKLYFNKVIGTIANKSTRTEKYTQWRHLDIQDIYDQEGWHKYITKDIDPTK